MLRTRKLQMYLDEYWIRDIYQLSNQWKVTNNEAIACFFWHILRERESGPFCVWALNVFYKCCNRPLSWPLIFPLNPFPHRKRERDRKLNYWGFSPSILSFFFFLPKCCFYYGEFYDDCLGIFYFYFYFLLFVANFKHHIFRV